MLLPVIYLSKHWKAIECWKNQHFQLKKYSLLLRECFLSLIFNWKSWPFLLHCQSRFFKKFILSFSSFTFTCIWCILQKIDMLIRIMIRICANLMIVIWVLVGFYYIISGKHYDVRDNRGWTAVHEAAYAGNTGCLEFLLRQGQSRGCRLQLKHMPEIRFDAWNFKKLSFASNEMMYLFVSLPHVFGGKWNWSRLSTLNCGWYVIRLVTDSVV